MAVRLVRVVRKQPRECLFAHADDQLRRRLTPLRVHPHVERPDALVAEAAIGIVELHRGDAEVRQNHIGVFETLGREGLRQAGEVGVARDERVGAETGRAQVRFRARQLEADRRRAR